MWDLASFPQENCGEQRDELDCFSLRSMLVCMSALFGDMCFGENNIQLLILRVQYPVNGINGMQTFGNSGETPANLRVPSCLMDLHTQKITG